MQSNGFQDQTTAFNGCAKDIWQALPDVSEEKKQPRILTVKSPLFLA